MHTLLTENISRDIRKKPTHGVGMSSDSTDKPAMSNRERITQNNLSDSSCTPDFRGEIQIESISYFKEILRIKSVQDLI